MAGLKTGRTTDPRRKAILAVFARAAGKRVFGFASDWASCAEVKPDRVPPEFDFLCVEGDGEWIRVPREKELR